MLHVPARFTAILVALSTAVSSTTVCKRGKSVGGFGARQHRSAVGCQKMAESRAPRSDCERMLHLRAHTFASVTAVLKILLC
jgi:hypothetical protein